jgi:hypothetical protein
MVCVQGFTAWLAYKYPARLSYLGYNARFFSLGVNWSHSYSSKMASRKIRRQQAAVSPLSPYSSQSELLGSSVPRKIPDRMANYNEYTSRRAIPGRMANYCETPPQRSIPGMMANYHEHIPQTPVPTLMANYTDVSLEHSATGYQSLPTGVGTADLELQGSTTNRLLNFPQMNSSSVDLSVEERNAPITENEAAR